MTKFIRHWQQCRHGENIGVFFQTYSPALDENEWSLHIGIKRIEIGRTFARYKYWGVIVWRPLANCFWWRSEFLGVEHGRVVIQYRICGLQPIAYRSIFRRKP